jgi:hypothetical protein
VLVGKGKECELGAQEEGGIEGTEGLEGMSGFSEWLYDDMIYCYESPHFMIGD